MILIFEVGGHVTEFDGTKSSKALLGSNAFLHAGLKALIQEE